MSVEGILRYSFSPLCALRPIHALTLSLVEKRSRHVLLTGLPRLP